MQKDITFEIKVKLDEAELGVIYKENDTVAEFVQAAIEEHLWRSSDAFAFAGCDDVGRAALEFIKAQEDAGAAFVEEEAVVASVEQSRGFSAVKIKKALRQLQRNSSIYAKQGAGTWASL